MLCLSAVVKAATGPSHDLQMELATHIWLVLLKNTGTNLSPKEIKFLPEQGFLAPLMTQMSNIFSQLNPKEFSSRAWKSVKNACSWCRSQVFTKEDDSVAAVGFGEEARFDNQAAVPTYT